MSPARGGDVDAEDALAAVPLFAALPDALRVGLAATSRMVEVCGGEWLFRQGDAGDSLYIVLSGRLEIVLEDPPPARVLDLVGPGGSLGELALLTAGKRTASVRAIRDTTVLAVDRPKFDSFLEGDPGFAAALSRGLAARLEHRVPALPADRRRPSVIAVVSQHDGVPTAEVANALTAALARVGGGTAVAVVDPPDDGTTPSGTSLDELEQGYDYVVLAASGAWRRDRWSEVCVRQADRVLAVVDAGRPPGADTPVARGPLVDVAFLRRPVMPAVAAWLHAFRPHAHHYIDSLRASPGSGGVAVERMARRIAGRAVGLVLSGGGARGLAHIGVLAALADAGVQIDRLGGTSMGSLVAGLTAVGRSHGEILELCRSELVARNPFNDYTVPRNGLIKGRRAQVMLERLFGSARVEETRRPFFAVSADLVSGDEVVHRTGLVAAAVGISMCLPGLVPPVPAGIRLLVDGGVLNNLPVDVMAATDEGPVIAVDVTRKMTPRGSGGTEDRPLLPTSRVSRAGRTPGIPSLVETLARSTVLGSWRKSAANRAMATVMIAPELSDVGLLEFRRIAEIVASGRAATEAALAASPLPRV